MALHYLNSITFEMFYAANSAVNKLRRKENTRRTEMLERLRPLIRCGDAFKSVAGKFELSPAPAISSLHIHEPFTQSPSRTIPGKAINLRLFTVLVRCMFAVFWIAYSYTTCRDHFAGSDAITAADFTVRWTLGHASSWWFGFLNMPP